MNVLITGGAGYIGTELVNQLAHEEKVDKLFIYDNLSRKNFNLFFHTNLPNDKISFIEGDLLDSRKLKNVLKDVDTVIHLAAKVTTPFASQDPHFFEQVNHWGTAELVYAIEESNVQHLIYVSSTSVYGAMDEMVEEDRIPQPKTYYGISKMRGEEHVNRLKDKLKTHIIRLGNVYGFSPSMRFDAVINRFILEANFKNRISIDGNGKQHRAFIHVNKVVNGLSQVLENPIPSGTYHLVDKNLSVLDIAFTLEALYPSLEKLFINQHLTLKELKVNPNSRLLDYLTIPKSDFQAELEDFKHHFSFHPFA